MNTDLTRAILAQTTYDSARPTGTAVTAHRFDEEGEFALELRRGRQLAGQVDLRVIPAEDDAGDATAAKDGCGCEGGAGTDTRAAHLDVAPRAAGSLPTDLRLQAGGWLSLTGGRPGGDGQVVVRPRKGGKPVWDAGRLEGDDVFGLTLLRPGRYEMRNETTGAQAAIVVPYPTRGKAPFRPPAPQEVVATADAFSAKELVIQPGQGLVVRFEAPSRIVVALREPDDGPRRPAAKQRA